MTPIDAAAEQATRATPVPRVSPRPIRLPRAEHAWLLGALAISLLFIWRAMAPGLPADAIQDDARIYLFWPLRLRDPDLFRGDLIADYYWAVTPPGYSALYGLLGFVIDPLTLSKLLPPLLGLLAALFTFLFTRRLNPSPLAAWLGTALLSWYVWRYDDLPSATPRAFVLPILAALLWALAAGRSRLAVGLVVAAALFYPIGAAIGLTLLGLGLVRLHGWRPTVVRERGPWLTLVTATLLVAVVLLPSQLASAPYGPVTGLAQGRKMAEFGPNGRQGFFVDDPFEFWIEGTHSGLDLRAQDGRFRKVPLLLEYALLAAPLPLLLLLRRRLPGAARVHGAVAGLLPRLLIASFTTFFLAHLLLFRLYLPNRYVKWSLPLVLAIAGGLVVAIVIESIGGRFGTAGRRLVTGGAALALALLLALYPARFLSSFVRDPSPAVTAFARTLPKEVLIAGTPSETNGLPTFARRKVLASYEAALPYHLGYYGQMRERLDDLIDAYYTRSPAKVQRFLEQYGVDYLLVNRDAYHPSRYTTAWTGYSGVNWEPFTTTVARRLKDGDRFALLDLAARCAVFDDGRVAVLPASCILTAE